MSELSDIQVNHHLVPAGRHRILAIGFKGNYRFGSAGNDDASYMHAAATAAVEAMRPSAIILDFRDLTYVWGDMLELVYDAAPDHAADIQTFSVIVGRDNREALRTLELGELSEEPITSIPWMHEDLDAARDYLIRLLDENATAS